MKIPPEGLQLSRGTLTVYYPVSRQCFDAFGALSVCVTGGALCVVISPFDQRHPDLAIDPRAAVTCAGDSGLAYDPAEYVRLMPKGLADWMRANPEWPASLSHKEFTFVKHQALLGNGDEYEF